MQFPDAPTAVSVGDFFLRHITQSPFFSQDNSGLLGESSPGLSSSKRLSKSNIDISAPNEGQGGPPLSRKQSDSYDGDTSSTGQHSFFSRWGGMQEHAHMQGIGIMLQAIMGDVEKWGSWFIDLHAILILNMTFSHINFLLFFLIA